MIAAICENKYFKIRMLRYPHKVDTPVYSSLLFMGFKIYSSILFVG